MASVDLTPKQLELIQEVQRITREMGEVPTLTAMNEHPGWPNIGTIRYHFKNYTELLTLADLPMPPCTKRYSINGLKKKLHNYILMLGRAPTQAEVHNDPRMPSDETYLNIYPTWEDAILATGFTTNWCSPKLKKKLILDLRKKYVDLGYKSPGPLDIQKDSEMAKVRVYVQVFGDLECAKRVAGVQDDYIRRQRKEIIETLRLLHDKLGRVPMVRDSGMPNNKLIKKVFGSYENALIAAGMEPHRRYYSRRQLIEQLQRKAAKLGRSPKVSEITADTEMASIQTFRKEFGNYAKALKAAKLPPAPQGKGHCYTRAELITQLQGKFAETGVVPTTRDANEDSTMASANVFSRTFGSFKLALEAAGISMRRARAKYTRDELIQQLREKTDELGHAPRQKDVEMDSDMASVNTLVNEFGSFTAALEAANLKVSRKREYTDEELLESLRNKYIVMGFLETGKPPTNKSINSDPEMASTRAYDTHFGTTNRARALVEKMLLEDKSAEEVLAEVSG